MSGYEKIISECFQMFKLLIFLMYTEKMISLID